MTNNTEKLIAATAERQKRIANSTFAITTEDGEGMGVIGTAQVQDAYWIELSALHAEIAELTKQRDELKERMHAAEKYISESPCDPDIYPEQLDAYMSWKEIVSAQEGPSE